MVIAKDQHRGATQLPPGGGSTMFVRHRCCGRAFLLEWKRKGYERRPFLWDQGEDATGADLVTSCPECGCALGYTEIQHGALVAVREK